MFITNLFNINQQHYQIRPLNFLLLITDSHFIQDYFKCTLDVTYSRYVACCRSACPLQGILFQDDWRCLSYGLMCSSFWRWICQWLFCLYCRRLQRIRSYRIQRLLLFSDWFLWMSESFIVCNFLIVLLAFCR